MTPSTAPAIVFPIDVAEDSAAGLGQFDDVGAGLWVFRADFVPNSGAFVQRLVDSFADAHSMDYMQAHALLRTGFRYVGGDVYFDGFDFC